MTNERLSREQLVKLAKRIQNAQDAGKDHARLLTQFQANVECPDVGELFSGDYAADYIVDFFVNVESRVAKVVAN